MRLDIQFRNLRSSGTTQRYNFVVGNKFRKVLSSCLPGDCSTGSESSQTIRRLSI